MSSDIPLDLDFSPVSDTCVELGPLLRRVVAGNSGAFTFTGTCSYIVGRGRVAIVDPGPDRPEHVAALLEAVRGETVEHVVVTHTHLDHSPAAVAVKAATGAMVVGCGPHRAARPLRDGETLSSERGGDRDYRPDHELRDGEAVSGPGWTLQAVATPGHTANHLCFALPEADALLSGDHVMGWSTTFVGPPDGSMAAYMASLEKLCGRAEAVFWPGHGGPVREPQRFVRAVIVHRRQREIAILGRLAAGDRTIEAVTEAIYRGLKPALRGAAALSVFAHLEDLVTRGAVASDGPARLDGTYRPASR